MEKYFILIKLKIIHGFQVKHLNLARYVDMLDSGDYHDNLDVVTEVHTSTGKLYQRRSDLFFYRLVSQGLL